MVYTMPFCRKCGKELEPNNKFCKYCGTPVQQNEAAKPIQPEISSQKLQEAADSEINTNRNFCIKCGAQLRRGVKFCEKCGSPVTQRAQDTKDKDFIHNSADTQNSQNFYGGYYPPQSEFTGQNSAYNTGYASNASQADKKSKSKAPIIAIAAVAVVLVAVIIVGAIFLVPELSGKSLSANLGFYENNTATEAATSITTQPETEAPATLAPQTEPQTEAPKALTNDKPYDQYIKVVSNGSNATLSLYEWQSSGWTELMSANATVGKNGVGTNYGEGKNVTPAGTYNLGFCYGLSKPVTGLDFKQLNSNSIFVDDPLSPYYNCLVTTNEYKGSEYENTYNQFARNNTYSTNIFIEHNGDGETPNSAQPYDGSVITICGYNGTLKPTLGCIDISSNDMTKLLAYLDSSKNPVIIIS